MSVVNKRGKRGCFLAWHQKAWHQKAPLKQDSSRIRSQGRATQGVKIINLKEDDKLVSLGKVSAQNGEDNDSETEEENTKE